MKAENIVVLTSAGISAESGLKTFRDNDGLWEGHRVEDVATPEAFRRSPARVQRFYNMRRAQLQNGRVAVNAAHTALAQFEQQHRGQFTLITQNVDDLHERGGASGVLHMHGELLRAKCAACDWAWDFEGDMGLSDVCPACQSVKTVRPDIVWFGEMPYDMDEIFDHLAEADIFAAIGTSGNVYPAAGFVAEAARAGAHTIEFNLEPSAGSPMFDQCRHGKAGTLVPIWTQEIIDAL